ncbi:MAG: hypothetical protein AAGA54_04490 [Myxococcota bacterium]
MRSTSRIVLALSSLALCGVAAGAQARSKSVPVKQIASQKQIGSIHAMDIIEEPQFFHGGGFMPAPDFALDGQPVGGAKAPVSTQPAGLHGSSVAMVGTDVLVVDADSGTLIRTDRAGTKLASLTLGVGAAQVVVDDAANRAYVTDRKHDRVVVVDIADGLTEVDALRTQAEPFGVALSPDRGTLLVTTVADKSLTAFDLSTGFEAWSLTVGPEPRGVAISPNGKEALVTFLTTGVVGRVALGDDPRIDYVSMDPAAPSSTINPTGLPKTSDDQGRSFARNAFAAVYAGNGVAVVPHQLSTPHASNEFGAGEGGGGYGGGGNFAAPITHRLAFLGMPDQGTKSSVDTAFATTSVHQPRAATYDAASDTLFVVGYGSDDVLAVADVSQAGVHMAWKAPVPSGRACGADGIAFDAGSDELVVFCSLSRSTHRMTARSGSQVSDAQSDELAKSHLSASAQRGQAIFRRGNSPRISTGGAMACTSCHAEARADGLTWFLEGNVLQTPFLSGRMKGSAPFKWDGTDADLSASVTNTVSRLGGTGLNKQEIRDVAAFLESVPEPRTPQPEEKVAVARGKKLFESDATGCAECHSGPLLTDRSLHQIAPDLPAVDTPSLVGLANSAPYYHDGSAPTLQSLLRGKGSIHGMGRTSKLSEGQVSDLVAYMESL